ncbi:MAG: hypothetical protein ABEL76_07330, partial [Bradymonadaceae bacterium]
LFVGFTPQLISGVWVGFDDNDSLGKHEHGGTLAAPIWLDYMKKAVADAEQMEFKPPKSGITTVRIDPKTGKLAREGGIKEKFLVGTAPTEYAPKKEESTEDDFLMNQFGGGTSDSGGGNADSASAAQ